MIPRKTSSSRDGSTSMAFCTFPFDLLLAEVLRSTCEIFLDLYWQLVNQRDAHATGKFSCCNPAVGRSSARCGWCCVNQTRRFFSFYQLSLDINALPLTFKQVSIE